MNPEITPESHQRYAPYSLPFQTPPAPHHQLHQHSPHQYQHLLQPFLNPQFLSNFELANLAHPSMMPPPPPPRIPQGKRLRDEFPGISGIEAIPVKRRPDVPLPDHGISPISLPVQTTHIDQYFTTGGAQEHSREFQETFEAEEDDDKADLHADHCSTNSPVVDGVDGEQKVIGGLSEKVIQMTDPLTQIVFEIGASQLSQMLQKNGKLKSKYNVNSNEIKQIKDKFCMAKTLTFVTEDDVQMLQNAGVQIVSVTNRDPQPSQNSRNQEFECKICKGKPYFRSESDHFRWF